MAKYIRAGSLREACIIQSQDNSEVNESACEITYTDVATIACAVSNISPFAVVQSRGYTDSLTHRFTVRWRPDLDISKFIVYKDVRYGIANMIDVQNKRQYFELYCYIVSDTDSFQNPSPVSGIFGGW